MFNTISMTQFASTIAGIMGIPEPLMADVPVGLVKELAEKHNIAAADRVLVYNPDAIAMWLFQKYTEEFAPVLRHVQLGLPVKTVMPSVTPVCFGTMYTGTPPQVHGIQAYEKHVITTDSLFDRLSGAGKKGAVVAVEHSSMAVLFDGRDIDYYILPYDDEVTQKALELIKEDKYHFIAVYHQEYDDQMHQTGPESKESLLAMNHHIQAFDRLAQAVKEHWSAHDSMLCWATDHGIHQTEDGRGNHGDAVESDLNVMHFYGMLPKERN